MTNLNEIINKFKNTGSIYYFDADNGHKQDEIIDEFKKLIDLIGESNIKIKEVDSLKEFFDLNPDEFNFVILSNAEEDQKFIKNSKYLVFYNEKLKNSEKLEDAEKKNLLEIDEKFRDFFSKNSGFRRHSHRIFKKKKKKNIKSKKDPDSKKSPIRSWAKINEFLYRTFVLVKGHRNAVMAISLVSYLLIIIFCSAIFKFKFFPFLISSLIFCIFSCPLILSVYKKYKASEEKESGKKWRRVNILRDIIDIMNILLGYVVIRVAIWVYHLLAPK